MQLRTDRLLSQIFSYLQRKNSFKMAEEKINCEIAWDSKGNPLFAIIPIQLGTMNRTAITDKGVLCIDGAVDNTSEEIVKIKDGKLIMVE